MIVFLRCITVSLCLILFGVIMTSQASEDVLGGSYTIKNRGHNTGLLCWTDREAPSGHLAQLLEDGKFDRDKILPGATWRESILWDISRTSEGAYTIKNRALGVGLLTWAFTEAPSGHFVQVLAERGYYPEDREKYLPGGRYRDSILWDISR